MSATLAEQTNADEDVALGTAPPAPATCAHCALPVPTALVAEGHAAQFCCGGCRAAFDVLHQAGLARYYELRQQRGRAVRRSGRSYEEFAHPAFERQYVRELPGGLRQVELYLEGVHCAACVWLVERVPLVLSGVVRAELDIRRSLAAIEWDPTSTALPAIAQTLDTLGYPPHPFRGVQREAMRRQEDRAALTRIGVAGAIAINVMLAALAMYSGWLQDGMDASLERYFRWISLALTVPALAGPGRVFFTSAFAAMRTRTLHLDLPIAIALGAGFIRGTINTLADSGPVYFDGVTMLIFLLLIGRYLQLRGQRLATDASELLYSLTPNAATVVNEERMQDVPAAALTPGMIVHVRPGDTVPADGVVVEGASSIDSALLTGESRPEGVLPGSPVFAGTINVSAALRVRVERSGEESRVARLLRQVEESARRRAPIVQLANRLAGWFVAVALGLALATFIIWALREPSQALDNAIALLIVTCPCALAMATPLAVTVAMGRAARRGIFIRGGDVAELLAKPGYLILDKTGTLTEGTLALISWDIPDWARPLVLSLEQDSRHPVAVAFRRAWSDVKVPNAANVEHVVGGGISGAVGGRKVVVGSPAFVAARSQARVDGPLIAASDMTPVQVAIDGITVGHAWFGDLLRKDSAAAVDALRDRGWNVRILSGDAASVVARAAHGVRVPPNAAVGGASPEMKLREVERLRAAGRPVVMVGDGVNDAAAIAAASVGIAVHGGAEASLASADVYLTRPGLAPLIELTDGAARTMRIIRRNILFSFGYNVVGVTLAMMGIINPLIAAVMMPLSSITVLL
ncbi:MAG: heavy metal translocating P-type ATPase, partial [Gemmatimonadaceae bacterium]